MFQEPCSGEDNDFISEEEIKSFKANKATLLQKRQELRDKLRKRFDKFQELNGCDHPQCPSSVCKELGNVTNKLGRM